MEEKISTLMSLLEINIVRFISVNESSCSFVIDGMLTYNAIESINEKYYMFIYVSAIEYKLTLCLVER